MSSIFQKKRIHEEAMFFFSQKSQDIYREGRGVPIQKTPNYCQAI